VPMNSPTTGDGIRSSLLALSHRTRALMRKTVFVAPAAELLVMCQSKVRSDHAQG